MKRIIYSLLAASTLCFATSCDLDLLENPNAVTASTASPDFLLNSIQLDYTDLYNDVSNDGMSLTRIINQGSAQYESSYTVQSTNAYWSNSYANILADIKFLEPLAEEANFQRHLGIAKTIKAMVLFHLVDSYGDVPLSEALDETNFFPNTDSGESVYSAALESLNQASAHFAATSAGSPNDYFYAGNYSKWIRLVNTLKLRYHLNLKLVDPSGSKSAIDALIAEGNLLKEGDDFAFRFGTNAADPDSRHPGYAGSYTSGGGTYHSTFYMWHMTEAKGFDDPRSRFYWYRQVTANPTDPALIECLTIIAPPQYLVQNFIYCLPGDRGYWGRDHLDPDGVPPDGLLRTVWGLYPAGGRFDDDSATPVNNPTLGAQGAGLFPIMLASYADFMLAEASLTLNENPATAKTYMLSGIRKHMNFVRNFGNSSQESGSISNFFEEEEIDLTTEINDYVTYVGNEYDTAPAGEKMYIIGREYWLSLFGNGVEALNLYKRTGQPSRMQPGLEPDAGLFPRTFLYPNNYMVTNNNAVQKENLGVQAFWDTNPAGKAWIY